jgi:hypothetical protein
MEKSSVNFFPSWKAQKETQREKEKRIKQKMLE